MPTSSRSRTLGAPPADVWRTVGDVNQLPRWWPLARRVEAVQGDEFTQVLRTANGRDVRADFVVAERDPGRLLRIEQQLEGTPFESLLRSATTEVRLQPAGEAATTVTITVTRRLRGLARFGGVMMRRGTNRQLGEALDGLAVIYGTAEVHGG